MKQIKKIGLWCILLFACIQISGCGDSQTSWKSGDHEISSELNYEKSMDLDYATEFAVDYYENGFTLISISDGSRFLLNTEGGTGTGGFREWDHSLKCPGVRYLSGCLCGYGYVLQYRCTGSHLPVRTA